MKNQHKQIILQDPIFKKLFTHEERHNLRLVQTIGKPAKVKNCWVMIPGSNILKVFGSNFIAKCTKIDPAKGPFDGPQ